MMGFDVNGHGTSATADVRPSPRGSNPSPKPTPPSTDAVHQPAKLASSVTSTAPASASGGYSLYSLIKKQSQSQAKPAPGAVAKPSTPLANKVKSSVPAGVLKKPSATAAADSLRAEKLQSAANHIAVSFAEPVEKVSPVDSASEQRFVLCICHVCLVLYLLSCLSCVLWPACCHVK